MLSWVGGARFLHVAMEEVCIKTNGVIPDVCEVTVEVGEETTCGDLITQMTQTHQATSRKGAWLLQEEWHGCRHWLAPGDPVPRGGVVTLHLKTSPVAARLSDPVSKWHKKISHCKKLDQLFLKSPHTFLSTSKVLTSRQLCCVSSCLQRQLDRADRKYSSALLQRLAHHQELWAPQAPTPLHQLGARFSSLEQENLKTSTEVSNLNISSTRLQQQLGPLSSKAEQLAGELSQLQEEVKTRREERAKNAPQRVEQMKSELEKLNKELEMKNQLNTGLNSKLQKVKDHLTKQRKVLEDKKREIERLRGWGMETQAAKQESTKSHSHSPDTKSPAVRSHSHSWGVTSPTSSTPLKRSTPSSSRKRHANIIEAKSKQLVEEEGLAFRQQQSVSKMGEGSDITTPSPVSGTGLLHIPPVDRKWYEDTGPEVKSTVEPNGLQGKGKAKSVHFNAEAIVLNVALEGELLLLKECITKLGGCGYSNDKGATCLHNAVCSGNFEAVSYLVDMSCDINAQDIDGWTPLHCAVAYSNLTVIRYLVEHGASLFLCTRDGDTPLSIAQEEHKLLGEGQKDAENTKAAKKCLEYLQEMENGLGVLNGGVVFALFSRTPKAEGELPLTEGERLVVQEQGQNKWWVVRNGRGHTGEVPSTFLGLYKQTKDVL